MYETQDNQDTLNQAIKDFVDRIAQLDERIKRTPRIEYLLEVACKRVEMIRIVDQLIGQEQIKEAIDHCEKGIEQMIARHATPREIEARRQRLATLRKWLEDEERKEKKA